MNDFVWQRSLAVADTEASGYHDNARRDLIDDLDFAPTRALDIGCGSGATFAYLKNRYPECETWGIEINRAAAAIAQTRLDHVASDKFEDVDLAAFGIQPESLDLILCADVLEHLYDPWSVVVKLKELLRKDGRLVISIPNLRYLPLLDDLTRGYFRYADWGLLDITHLRFFTRKELERFLFETGYEVVGWKFGLDPTLKPTFEAYRQKLPCTIDTGKMVLRNVDEDELLQLFSGQFFVTARKGNARLLNYEAPKMGCYFWSGQHNEYRNFLASHQLRSHEAQAFDGQLARQSHIPSFELIVVHRGAQESLTRTITAASRWLYDSFALHVLSDREAPAALQGHARIAWQKVGSGDTATGDTYWPAIAARFAASQADWLMVLEAGDELAPHALPYLAEYALRHPQAAALYVDEDSLAPNGQPEAPYLKPDFSPDYFLAQNYLGDGIVLSRTAVAAMGGLDLAAGDPLYGTSLRLFFKQGAAAFGHVPDLLFHRTSKRILDRQRNGPTAPEPAVLQAGYAASPGLLPGSWHVQPANAALPVLLVVADAHPDLATTRRFVESMLADTSALKCELVLFAARELPAEVLDYLDQVDRAALTGISIFLAPEGMNATGRWMAACENSTAGLLLLTRCDIAPSSTDWREALARQAVRPDVAAIAPKLVAADGTLTGNALLLGMQNLPSGLGLGERFDSPGHFGRLLMPQNPAALGPDVVMISRSALTACGGLDTALEPGAALIDYLQRARQQGYFAVWTPYVSVVCLGGPLSALSETDRETLLQRWLPELARDPGYNRNLSRQTAFALREHPQVSRLGLPWKPLPRLMAFPGDTMGCGHYRVIEPFEAALKAGIIDGYLGTDHYDPLDLAIFEADTLLLQRQITDAQIRYLGNYRRFFQLKLVYELDDLITNVPVESVHKGNIPKDIAKRIRQGLELCDRFIVSTEPLAHAYRHMIGDIRVVPNRIDRDKWGDLTPQRRQSDKPRVGWAGGVSHTGDLALIVDLVRETAQEVDWIFMGMCPEEIRPCVKEFHVGVPTPAYPAKLASLNLDLAVAPIAEHAFNDCKSNLKLLEYGILGFPVIASDFGPYRRSADFPVTLVKNRHKDWRAALLAHIHDLDACARQGDTLRNHIQRHWMLQDHLDDWRSAWFDFPG